MNGFICDAAKAFSAAIPALLNARTRRDIIKDIEAKGMTLEQLFETTGKEVPSRRLSKQVVKFRNPPKIIANMSVVGPKESKGPLKDYFGYVYEDDRCGQKTYEEAEKVMLEKAISCASAAAGIADEGPDALFAGDLLNQITTANFAARKLNAGFFGLYGACSTMAETLALASMLLDAGFINTAACATVSHFSTAERQYRGPLEYGNQRPQFAQWTVTGSGCSILSAQGDGPKITHAAIGRVIDFGVKDISNMGAAMAPAAMDTLVRFFIDTGFKPQDFDLIVTGDLGALGSDILRILMSKKGLDLGQEYEDCGQMIYSVHQHPYQGGSGSGCSAVVFNGYIMEKLRTGKLKRVLFAATGALMSVVTSQQGESIPCICHAVAVEGC